MKDAKYLIHPDTKLGHVHYTVADLDRQIAFYEHVLKMKLHWREGEQAGLGAGGEDLLQLTEVKGAIRVPRTTGMYHFALLYPDRKELARVIARLFEMGIANYPTDHIISKTTYLDDPEGNNIELYVYSLDDGTFEIVDGAWDVRHADGRPSNGREPLDLPALFTHLEEKEDLQAAMPIEVLMGHVHIYGSDLEASMHFYNEVLGFKYGGMATRVGFADVELDRPHVIAFNTWQGEGAKAAPPDSLGIRYFSIEVPNQAAFADVIGRVEKAGIAIEQIEAGAIFMDLAGVQIHLRITK
jgi:catechol 2,3-dioxygenase